MERVTTRLDTVSVPLGLQDTSAWNPVPPVPTAGGVWAGTGQRPIQSCRNPEILESRIRAMMRYLQIMFVIFADNFVLTYIFRISRDNIS